MAKKPPTVTAEVQAAQGTPMVAAALTGIVYQARLFNRQARMNVPEQEVISEVITLWRSVMGALAEGEK